MTLDFQPLPILETSAKSKEMQDYWAANPFYKVAYDQLLNGPTNVATAGSVIGNRASGMAHA